MGLLVGAAIWTVVVATGGRAQTPDCDRLYTALQAGDDTIQSGGQWTRAAQQQRAEIDRTQRYADQLGCDAGAGFEDAGENGPQCGGILDRLRRMRDNLDAIESHSMDDAGSGRRRADLLARYNAACVAVGGGNPANLAQRDGRGFLPEGGENPDDLRTGGLDPDGGLTAMPPENGILDGTRSAGANLGQAICVRSCDGGWFPLSPRANADQLESLGQLCQASCPNTEARIYTMPKADDLAGATGADGVPYTALPAAFAYEKKVTAACSCKPPHQSWAEALAGAEKLLGDPGKHDITVTAALSDQMAKPGAIPAVTQGKAPRTAKGRRNPAEPAADVMASRDAQVGARAPTASNATTGIGGPVHPERLLRGSEGPTVSVAGPDGTKRRIRLIVP